MLCFELHHMLIMWSTCAPQGVQFAAKPLQGGLFAGATNRPDALDAALRRAGRFDREIAMSIPSEAARASILRVLTRPLSLSGDFDFAAVAKRTPGFVGADLQVPSKAAIPCVRAANLYYMARPADNELAPIEATSAPGVATGSS